METLLLDGVEAGTMWIDYEQAITERADEWLPVARQQRGSAVADRVKMRGLLNTNAYPSQRQVARVGGYTERPWRCWWSEYAQAGLAALRRRERPGGRLERRVGATTPRARRFLCHTPPWARSGVLLRAAAPCSQPGSVQLNHALTIYHQVSSS